MSQITSPSFSQLTSNLDPICSPNYPLPCDNKLMGLGGALPLPPTICHHLLAHMPFYPFIETQRLRAILIQLEPLLI